MRPVTGNAATMFFCTFVVGGFSCTYRWHARLLTFAFVQYAVHTHNTWFTIGLAVLASCRFPFFTTSPAGARVLCLEHLCIIRQLFLSRMRWLGELALRSLLAGASTSRLAITRFAFYCSLKIGIAMLMTVATIATCSRPIAALAALAAFARSPDDPVALVACAALVSSFHCFKRFNCQLVSVLLYAWLLESPLDERPGLYLRGLAGPERTCSSIGNPGNS